MWGLLCGHLVAFKAPKSWPNKFLINVWGGFSVIFVASYTANIAALIAGLFFHHAANSYDSSVSVVVNVRFLLSNAFFMNSRVLCSPLHSVAHSVQIKSHTKTKNTLFNKNGLKESSNNYISSVLFQHVKHSVALLWLTTKLRLWNWMKYDCFHKISTFKLVCGYFCVYTIWAKICICLCMPMYTRLHIYCCCSLNWCHCSIVAFVLCTNLHSLQLNE